MNYICFGEDLLFNIALVCDTDYP